MTRISRIAALTASIAMLVLAGPALGETARYRLSTPGVV
jgi:hypothetical protein